MDLLKVLVSKTSLNIVAFDEDPARIDFLRDYFNKAGITAERLSFLHYNSGNPSFAKIFFIT